MSNIKGKTSNDRWFELLEKVRQLAETKTDFASSDGDDEFVSESYQASSKDIKEANASMKRLGVKGKTFQAATK